MLSILVSNDTLLYVQFPLKHWTKEMDWEMAENLFKVVQVVTKKIVSATPYFFVICNEVTTSDNQSLINIHVYTIIIEKMVPFLLKLERVIEGANNIMRMILATLTNEEGLTPHQIIDHFMAFGTDGASMVEEKNDVTNKLHISHAPHMQNTRCVAH